MYKVLRNPKIENVAGINVNHDGWKLMCPSKYNDTKKKNMILYMFIICYITLLLYSKHIWIWIFSWYVNVLLTLNSSCIFFFFQTIRVRTFLLVQHVIGKALKPNQKLIRSTLSIDKMMGLYKLVCENICQALFALSFWSIVLFITWNIKKI